MSGFFIALIEISMLFTAFITIPILIALRLLIALKAKKSIPVVALITLVPFSLGYFKFLKEEEKPKYYNIVLKVLVVVAFLGISFTLFQLIVPRYDYFL